MISLDGGSVRKRLSLLALWILVGGGIGCAVEPVPVNNDNLKASRYLRYTLRGAQSGFYTQAYRSNYLVYPAVFKPGSKVDFTLYSSLRVDMTINGLPCKMFFRDAEFPIENEGIKVFLDKHFTMTKEELKLEKLDQGVRNQVDQGVAAIGMTKEQVLLALGFPSHIDNYAPADPLTRERILESNQWVYRYNEIMFFPTYWAYQFDNTGKLAQVIR
jgi:hypothetical protein